MSTPTVKYTASCRLCQKAIVQAPPLNIPILGQPDKRMNEYMQLLTKHLGKHHQQEFQEGAALLDETLAFLVLTAYNHEDPTVDPRVEAIRARVFAKVRKNTVTDSRIEDAVARLGLNPDEEANVKQLLKGVRDACCEFGDYAPDRVQSTSSALVHTV